MVLQIEPCPFDMKLHINNAHNVTKPYFSKNPIGGRSAKTGQNKCFDNISGFTFLAHYKAMLTRNKLFDQKSYHMTDMI